jgi:class 3 adenylate cyclase
MHPDITIVFTDFVGFTSISSGLSAEEIVDFLNEVFVEFDLITELLKLDKIKTIGDAYFMTGGLDPSVTDHAMRVIEASIFMFEALGEHNGRHRDRKPLRMRLGVHTGPAVAGVIGTKKVAYDLWGPSVAIANAMESTGVPGFIHVSESAVAQTRGYYSFEPRGELPKEKGVPDPMPNTFLYKGRLVPTPYQFMRRPRNEPRQIAATPKKD